MIDGTVHLSQPDRTATFFRLAARLQAVGVLFAILFCIASFSFAPLVQAQETQRAKEIGNKLMCVCGCNEILTACNHVGCTYSHDMLKKIDERIARGDSDDLIMQSFVQEYGPKVLAEPPTSGFNWVAWIVPVVVPIMALLLLWIVVRRWRQRAVLSPAGGPPISSDFLDRARRESGRESDE